MKMNILAVAALSVITLLGMGVGHVDSINHSKKASAALAVTCKAQPTLDECVERKALADGVRYYFNGEEFRNGNIETTFGVAK